MNRFSDRFRWALVLSASVAAVIVLVVVYRASAPGGRPTGAGGKAVAEADVLKVGALPVT